MKYLIEEIQLSPIENNASEAVKYAPIGYFDTLEETLKFVNTGKEFTQKDCWAIWNGTAPQYRYKEMAAL